MVTMALTMEMMGVTVRDYLNLRPDRRELAERVAIELEKWRWEQWGELYESIYGD